MKFLLLIITFISVVQFSYLVKVTKLDKDNYKSIVLNSKKQWVILFHSPKCQSCQEFSSNWNTILESIEKAEFGIVDVEDAKGNKLAEELGVLNEGIPNIKYVANEDHIYSVKKGSETFEIGDILRRIRILNAKAGRGFFKQKKDKNYHKRKEEL